MSIDEVYGNAAIWAAVPRTTQENNLRVKSPRHMRPLVAPYASSLWHNVTRALCRL